MKESDNAVRQMTITFPYWIYAEFRSADQGPSTSPCRSACRSLNLLQAKHGDNVLRTQTQRRLCKHTSAVHKKKILCV